MHGLDLSAGSQDRAEIGRWDRLGRDHGFAAVSMSLKIRLESIEKVQKIARNCAKFVCHFVRLQRFVKISASGVAVVKVVFTVGLTGLVILRRCRRCYHALSISRSDRRFRLSRIKLALGK